MVIFRQKLRGYRVSQEKVNEGAVVVSISF